eukprot:TRINITY_DN8325_c0_g1_i2.p1 TRINITY_DN8325_c0_g1~~TRINITY_DN8325_c0_g1_i2.p1  ORF type:complete len:122 (+),score=21.05 TRINITY_DN8325_c0_g1_i2:633-998(+)
MNLSVLLDGRLPDGLYPLQKSVIQHRENMFHLFILKGANLNMTTSTGENILHIAVHALALPLVTFFLHNHPHLLDGVDNEGRTPIDLAALPGKETVHELIKLELKGSQSARKAATQVRKKK